MTDATATHDKDSHTPPPPTHKPLTEEQIAALSTSEKEELIAELTAAIAALQQPVPQPYPKWVEIGGVSMIVDSPEEEAAKIKADAAYRKEHPDHDLPGSAVGPGHPDHPIADRPGRGAHPDQPIAETPEPKGGRAR